MEYKNNIYMNNFLKTAGVIALLLVVYSLLQALFVGVAMAGYLVYDIINGSLGPSIFSNVEALIENPVIKAHEIDAMAIGMFLSAAAMLLFIHVTKLFRLRKSLFTSIAFRPLLLSTALVFTVIPTFNVLVQWLPLEDLLENEFDGLTHTVMGAFTISVLAPLLEEVMFRGAIQGYMMRRMRSPWAAIIAAALVFGIFHMNPVQVVYATLLGVVFGWIYYRTGSLMSVIVGHVLNNTIATIMMLLLGPTDEKELLNEYMPSEAVLASEIFTFVFFGALSVYLAVKLHKSLPPVPVPWHESCETGRDLSFDNTGC